MKKQHIIIILLLTLARGINLAGDPAGTTFTYQGVLTDSSGPLNGKNLSIKFDLYDAATPGQGTLVGTTTKTLDVNGGLITTTLDFGPTFSGGARWLEITVGANPPLGPRQQLTPTPYAIFAESVANGAITASQLSTPQGGPSNGQFLEYSSGALTWASPGGLTLPYSAPLEIDSSASDLSSQEFLRLSYGPSDYHSISAFFNGGPGQSSLSFNVEYASGDIRPTMTLNGTGVDVNGVVTAKAGTIAGSAGSIFGGALPVLSVTNSSSIGYGITVGGTTAIRAASQSGNVAVLAGATSAASFSASTPAGPVVEMRNNATGLNTTLGTLKYTDASGNAQGQIAYGINTGFAFWAGGAIQMNVLANGTVSVPVLQITGGSDVAEPFHLSNTDTPNGAVVIIDDQNPGQLRPSERAYDRRVAGIVSGANGIKPGLSLSQQGVIDGGRNVALTGRVYALADASFGSIRPGDLLTTSDTPGHCMKVTDQARAQGAIIGKAMSSLGTGKGMVLVLVSLQ